jgi:hypothetical protein
MCCRALIEGRVEAAAKHRRPVRPKVASITSNEKRHSFAQQGQQRVRNRPAIAGPNPRPDAIVGRWTTRPFQVRGREVRAAHNGVERQRPDRKADRGDNLDLDVLALGERGVCR